MADDTQSAKSNSGISLDSEKSIENELDKSTSKTNESDKRFYALYSYVAHRFQRSGQKDDSVKDNNLFKELSVSDFLQAEATADGDFSLSVVSTNLSAEKETGLRKCLAHKISRGAVYSGTGSIVSLNLSDADDSVAFSCQMYFSLLRHLDQTAQEGNGKGVNSREFVLCFLADPEDGLDLFQKELDQYSQGLLKLIDAELTEINTGIRDYLEKWYDVAIQYIQQCVNTLGQAARFLIYCAMTGNTLKVKGEDADTEALFHRFVDCCGLTELLHSSVSDKHESSPVLVDLSDSAEMVTTHVDNSNTIVLRKEGNTYECDKQDLPKFCMDWSEALAGGSNQSSASLRRIIESYKLKCIQDVNSLTRLIRLAENDFYALYRAYVFLKTCGNGKILLSYTQQEQQVSQSVEGASVLRALEEYIQDTGGLTS
ncbi:protein Njmu-R1-like isoform X2 [Liolophura sinensis]|uniref:protein Njmu-R1-like isoform X2 n=1 Tax=Liolophura sinensis TaxID=3198878 RepID=UPI003157FE77